MYRRLFSLYLCPLPPVSSQLIHALSEIEFHMLFHAHLFPSGFFFTRISSLLFLITMTHSPFGSVRHNMPVRLLSLWQQCLMLLRQFPADTDACYQASPRKRLQRADQSVRCFVDHHCSCLIFQFIQDSLSPSYPSEEMPKCESSRSKPGYRKAVTHAQARTAVTVIPASSAISLPVLLPDQTRIGDHRTRHSRVFHVCKRLYYIHDSWSSALIKHQKSDTVPVSFAADQICSFSSRR